MTTQHIPGALAIVQGCPHPGANGKTCELLYRCPAGDFTLPCGYPAVNNAGERSWVVKFPAPVAFELEYREGGRWAGAHRTPYGPLEECHLKVIGGPGVDLSMDAGEDLYASPWMPAVTGNEVHA